MSVKSSISRSIAVMSLLLYSLTGCDDGQNVSLDKKCLSENGETFLGTPECIAQFEDRRISGYWVVGLEYSLLYQDMDDVVDGEESEAFSLQFLGIPSENIRRILVSPRLNVYNVSFIGSKSDLPGIYAEGFPDLRGGVVVKKDFSFSDPIRDVRP